MASNSLACFVEQDPISDTSKSCHTLPPFRELSRKQPGPNTERVPLALACHGTRLRISLLLWSLEATQASGFQSSF